MEHATPAERAGTAVKQLRGSSSPVPRTPENFIVYSFFNYEKVFPSQLMFLLHKPTNVSFLADTGSMVNIITARTLRGSFPECDVVEEFFMTLSGIGGSTPITHVVWVPLGGPEPVPFFTGPKLPADIISYTYIEKVSSSPDVVVEERAPWAPFPELNEHATMLICEREHVAPSDLITPRLFPAGPIPCCSVNRRKLSGSTVLPCYSANRRKLSGSTVLPCCRANCRKSNPVPQFHEAFREGTLTSLEGGLGSNLIEPLPSPSPIEVVSEGKLSCCGVSCRKLNPVPQPPVSSPNASGVGPQEDPFPPYSVSPDCIDPNALRNKLSKLRAKILKLDSKPPTRDWNAPDNTLISENR